MTEVPDHITEYVYRRVQRDLEPPWHIVHAKIGLSIGAGGLVTLFLCGQLGLGLSSLAERVHHALMGVMGFFGCTVVCGILFAVIPVATLRAMSSGIQFLVLIRKKWREVAGWTLAFGSLIAYQNNRSDTLWVLLLWSVTAVASFEVLARLLHRLSLLYYRLTEPELSGWPS